MSTLFQHDYWLSDTVRLDDATPIAEVRRFCEQAGLQLCGIGPLAADRAVRATLYRLLEARSYPHGPLRTSSTPRAVSAPSPRRPYLRRLSRPPSARPPPLAPPRPPPPRRRAHSALLSPMAAGRPPPPAGRLSAEELAALSTLVQEQAALALRLQRALRRPSPRGAAFPSPIAEDIAAEEAADPTERAVREELRALRQEVFSLQQQLSARAAQQPSEEEMSMEAAALRDHMAALQQELSVWAERRAKASLEQVSARPQSARPPAVCSSCGGAPPSCSAPVTPRPREPPVLPPLAEAEAAELRGVARLARIEPPPRACESLAELASVLGVEAPTAGVWLEELSAILEMLPLPVVVADAGAPGLPLAYVNEAFEQMTGYSREEAVGKNCRFLQGKATEPRHLQHLVSALRRGATVSVTLTNYKADGSEFLNELSICRVADHGGGTRFFVGILVNALQPRRLGNYLEHLRRAAELVRKAMPKAIHADASQPPAMDPASRMVHPREALKQWHHAVVSFSRLSWVSSFPDLLSKFASSPWTATAVARWFTAHAAEDLGRLELVLLAAVLDSKGELTEEARKASAAAQPGMLPPPAPSLAIDLAEAHLGERPASVAAALERLQPLVEESRIVLCAGAFADFVASEACVQMLSAALGDPSNKSASSYEAAQAAAAPLFGAQYRMAPDCKAWLCALALACQALPTAVAISDMTLPGNPLVYVNPEFVTLTGYSREDALGKNCRFLQGKRTDPASVNAMLTALRKGRPSYTVVSNYRSDGLSFRNLVALRPVHDSTGALRFCIGLLGDAIAMRDDPVRLLTQAYILNLLPSTITVASPPVGNAQKRHQPAASAAGGCAAQLDKLQAALSAAVRQSNTQAPA